MSFMQLAQLRQKGRDGRSQVKNGNLDFKISTPKELKSTGVLSFLIFVAFIDKATKLSLGECELEKILDDISSLTSALWEVENKSKTGCDAKDLILRQKC
ncbi:hypothetical protein PHSC3_000691 [Chlamydiales bacterium STE3]|nr:hypothetical protein PHSC3_000691 [Chlamydiales bacterium STE3]